ncbi:MAG: GxxExxY protein [Gammaproteobacteria bacterium]|nr:GxxExxY protein [Gammaproteobacteria bacterium]
MRRRHADILLKAINRKDAEKGYLTAEHAEHAEYAEENKEVDVSGRDRLTQQIIACAIEVHRHLGPGLLESAYEECLCWEFSQHNISFERQCSQPVSYKGMQLNCGFRMDIVVDNQVVLELKSVETLLPLHQAQLISYLRLSGLERGLLINFNVPILSKGIKRIVNQYNSAPSAPLR